MTDLKRVLEALEGIFEVAQRRYERASPLDMQSANKVCKASIKAITILKAHMEGPKGEISDGYHTFNELYEHRHILFLSLLTANPDRAWRSKLHSDGTMFDGWFIAGLQTDLGHVTYHLPIRMWTLFDKVKEIGQPNR